jgi:TM2 domain-containing membrane protein YozV
MLSNEDQLLLNSELQKRGKNKLIAFLLLFFLGTVGGHRFYIGKGGAVLMLILTLTGIGAIISIPMAIIDVFRISGWVDDHNQRIENEVTQQLLIRRGLNHD